MFKFNDLFIFSRPACDLLVNENGLLMLLFQVLQPLCIVLTYNSMDFISTVVF